MKVWTMLRILGALLLSAAALVACSEAKEGPVTPEEAAKIVAKTPTPTSGAAPSTNAGANLPAATSQTPTKTSAGAPSPLNKRGAHRIGKNLALVFEVGMPRIEVEAMIKSATEGGKAKVIKNDRATRRNEGVEAEVQTLLLEFGKTQSVSTTQLTLFGEHLVGVLNTFRLPNTARLKHYQKTLGEGNLSDAWVGWWDPHENLIIQVSRDGGRYEIFSLAAASKSVPRIQQLMQKQWLRRYGAPPPWAASLVPSSTP